MIYLLSTEGHEALRAVASRSILYAFDFDGTLAPISPDRGAVNIPRPTAEWLTELAKRVPCAVVSGRALADLTPRINGAVPYVIGNHGLESPLTSPDVFSLAEHACLTWMKRVATDLAQPLKVAGVEVENKRYSLTFHYRGADDPFGIRRVLLQFCMQLTPTPRCIFGKASVNVLPPGGTGKGEATLALMNHLRCAGLFFAGDDETDEDVFGLSEELMMGVRVGHHAESRAQYYLRDPAEMEEVIRFLIGRMDGTPESSAIERRC